MRIFPMLLAVGVVTAGLLSPSLVSASPRATSAVVRRPHARVVTAVTGHTGYYTYHYDNGRDGWNPNEVLLTQSRVASSHFGLIRTLAGDSVVYAQPLYVPNLTLGNATHNVVIFATENDSLYAYDADTGALLFHRSFIDPSRGITAVSTGSVGGCGQITPTIGISSTPVIDPATQTLYLVDKIQISRNGTTTYHNLLYAISLTTGANKVQPIEIKGSVKLSDGNTDTFMPQWQQNRPGLLLVNGNVYVTFASSCDENASVVHGWVFAYNESNLQLSAIFNTSTTDASSYLAGIWQSTFAPAADSAGNIYFETGNGAFDAQNGGTNYGESVLRMTPQLTVADYFAPYNEADLSNKDQDMSTAGVMLIPGSSGSPIPLAVAGVKNGEIYLLNQNKLGEFNPKQDNIVQEFSVGGYDSLFGGAAYYDDHVYWGSGGKPMLSFALSVSPSPKLTLQSHTPNNINGYGGEIPAVSSNGTTAGSAIVWTTDRPATGGNITLYAYDATNLGTMLFSGTVGTWQASATAFLTPTVADGHVFVPGAGYGIAEFGLH